MKQKFFNAFAVLAMLVLSVTLSNQSIAQSTEGTTVQKQAVVGNQPTYLKSDNTAEFKKTSNGGVIIDNNGTVQLTVVNNDGSSKIETIAKPMVSASVTPNQQDMDVYIANYTKWMKANPDYTNYITSVEADFIRGNDMGHLYKWNFQMAQKQSEANKANK